MNLLRDFFIKAFLAFGLFPTHEASAQRAHCNAIISISCYLNDPLVLELLLDGTEKRVARSRLLMEYGAGNGDVQAFLLASEELDVMVQILERLHWARAVLAAEHDNFGPLQEHMNISYPDLNIELRPYTDGTMDILVNEAFHSRRSVSDVLGEVVEVYAPDGNWRRSISPNGIDTNWAWDQFRDEYGNRVWRCRGRQSGEFIQDIFCIGDFQRDYTWPGN